MAIALNLFRNGAVGFIVWLDVWHGNIMRVAREDSRLAAMEMLWLASCPAPRKSWHWAESATRICNSDT